MVTLLLPPQGADLEAGGRWALRGAVPKGLCRSSTPTPGWKAPSNQCTSCAQVAKAPRRPGCLLRRAGLQADLVLPASHCVGSRPQDQSDLEIPSQGPTNLRVCTGECVRVTSLEYTRHTTVWTLEESSRSSVQAIQERPSREASQEARMSRQPSTCTSQECCCVKPTPDRSGLGSPARFGVAVKRTVPDGKDTEK